MKTNTTLQSLDLEREQKMRKMDELQTLLTTNTKQTDTGIGDEGAETLSEALKTNTTLKSLNLRCEQE